MNNCAIIVKLRNVRKHPNADRLQLATVLGTQIVVGLDTIDGQIGIYFDSNLQLSEVYCKNNNLYSKSYAENNIDVEKFGYASLNRRVRTIKLKGETSNGLFMPLESCDFISGYGKDYLLKKGENFEFTELNGIEICRKYIIPNKNNSLGNANGKNKTRKVHEKRIIDNQFRFHFDTSQLARNLHHLYPNDIASLSWKFHGTSSITSNCMVLRDINWVEKLINRFKFTSKFIKVNRFENDYIFASRKVIKNDDLKVEHNHFYGYDLWAEAGKKFDGLLHNGEAVYYEIVGFTNTGGFIQGKSGKDGKLGFDYNCEPNEYKIYIYRITQTTTDGHVIELQWKQLKERCNQIGFEHVPEIFYGKLKDLGNNASKYYLGNKDSLNIEEWRNILLADLKETYLEKDSIFCKNKVPEEGIVLRIDGLEIKCFKYKADAFWAYEDKCKEENVVDIEEDSTEYCEEN